MKQQVMELEPSAEIEGSGEAGAPLSAFAAPRGFLPPYWRPGNNGGGSNGGGAPVGGSAAEHSVRAFAAPRGFLP